MTTRLAQMLLCVAITVLATQGGAQSCGDCNEDGALNILDALLSAQINVGLEASPLATSCATLSARCAFPFRHGLSGLTVVRIWG